METAIMAMRVALLILVTGVFAALWAGDHPERVAAKTLPSGKVDESRPVSPQRTSDTLTRYPSEPKHSAGHSILLATSNLSNIPLPAGISAGTYLVADQTGRTQVRVIRADDNNGSESISNHYTIEMSGARWHFIRIDPSLNDRIATESIPTSIR